MKLKKMMNKLTEAFYKINENGGTCVLVACHWGEPEKRWLASFVAYDTPFGDFEDCGYLEYGATKKEAVKKLYDKVVKDEE